ncbi:MAG TPA: hypothetical protein VH374_09585 [Polyangia bacterium]|jgi:hypothetical protein|nr:hypothetical protein [Polyangia bacterium]
MATGVLAMAAVAACSGSSGGGGSGGSGGSGSGGQSGGSGGSGGTTGPTGGTNGSGGASSGSGGAPVAGSGGAAVVDDAGSVDAAADTKDTAGSGDAGGAGAALSGFLFNVPCNTPPQAGDCQGTPEAQAKTVTIQFGGDPAVIYDVKMHVCGAVEGRPYTGCTANQATYFCTDGAAATSGFNPTYPIYQMKVSAPAHSYFVNNRDLKDDIFMIDYDADVKIQGGASITFSTASEGTDMYTPLLKGHNFTCPGVPGITQPYAGQFFYLTTTSVAPAP